MAYLLFYSVKLQIIRYNYEIKGVFTSINGNQCSQLFIIHFSHIMICIRKQTIDDISSIPPSNDYRLNEIRMKQQQRTDRMSEITKSMNSNHATSKKLSAKNRKIKNSSAYKYATTGDWGGNEESSDRKRKYHSSNSSLPRYRPPNPFQRHGRRPGGGGG